MDAIVTDTHTRTSVAGLRGLGRTGLDVLAIGPDRTAAGLWSRYAAGRAEAPLPSAGRTDFTELIARLAVRHGPLVVYPGRETSIDAVLDARPQLPPAAVLPYPGREPLALLRDKGALATLSADAGMTAPRILFDGAAGELPAGSLPARCVVKPARPGGAAGSARIVGSRTALAELASSLPARERIIVQEHLGGPLAAIAVVLARDGRLAARFQQRALRIWPAAAGISAAAVSVAPDERLVASVTRMLRAAGYWGLAQVQFLESPRGPAVIDVNPRFYGSLPLALAAGVNLPAEWHNVTLGKRQAEPRPYRQGVRYRWLEADIVAAVRGRPRALLERTPGPTAGAMWAADDPLPAAVLAVKAVTLRARRRIRASRGTDSA